MFSSKSKGLFVEFSEYSILAAVTSGLEPPFVVESLHECPGGEDSESVRAFIDGLRWKKAGTYMKGRCGVYPKSRFLRRTTLESPAKAKQPNFFAELLNSQFRIDPSKNSVAVVNAVDGTEFSEEKGVQNQKELMFCGASTEEFNRSGFNSPKLASYLQF